MSFPSILMARVFTKKRSHSSTQSTPWSFSSPSVIRLVGALLRFFFFNLPTRFFIAPERVNLLDFNLFPILLFHLYFSFSVPHFITHPSSSSLSMLFGFLADKFMKYFSRTLWIIVTPCMMGFTQVYLAFASVRLLTIRLSLIHGDMNLWFIHFFATSLSLSTFSFLFCHHSLSFPPFPSSLNLGTLRQCLSLPLNFSGSHALSWCCFFGILLWRNVLHCPYPYFR